MTTELDRMNQLRVKAERGLAAALEELAKFRDVGESLRHDALVPELRGVADYLSNRTKEYQSVVLAAVARIVSDAQENAKLKVHAEEMANDLDVMGINAEPFPSLKAYRAAFPKEKP